MNRLESELFDLEELLLRNDGIADDSTYSTIVGIANDVSELEDENAKLRELVRNLYKRFHGVVFENWSYSTEDFDMLACCMRELGVEVDA